MFNRLIELLLGLDKGFLSKEGELTLQWNPRWPGEGFVPATAWNLLLGAIAIMLVIYVYRREARSTRARLTLGLCRAAVLGILLALLNRPVLTLMQSRVEPSVLAIMLDDSVSMRVRDVVAKEGAEPVARLDAVINLLNSQDQDMVRQLAKVHTLRFYTFDRDAQPLATVANAKDAGKQPDVKAAGDPALAKAIGEVKPVGKNTQVVASVKSVLT